MIAGSCCRYFWRAALCVLLLLPVAGAAAVTGVVIAASVADAAQELSPLDSAIDAGVGSLEDAQRRQQWRDEVGGDYEFGPGGRSAVCAIALLKAGVDPRSEIITATLGELLAVETDNIRSRALRLTLLAMIADDKSKLDIASVRRRDFDYLRKMVSLTASFGLTASETASGSWDNYSSYLVHRAFMAAARRGLTTGDAALWRSVVRHWQMNRLGDGGWSFDANTTASYGSITAAGASVLIGAESRLDDGRIANSDLAKSDFSDPALRWLAKNFSSWSNPGRGPQYYYRWVDSLAAAADASGVDTLAGGHWRSELTGRLLSSQRPDGSWGSATNTAMAISALCELRRPLMFAKLKYNGSWNARSFDLARVTQQLSSRFERQLSWRLVDIEGDPASWRDVKVLYITGFSPPRFSDAQLDKLRSFVYRGGMIFSVAAGDSPGFNVAMRRIYAKLFGDYKLRELPVSHPVFNAYKQLGSPPQILAVDNGVRLLAMHCSRDIAAQWYLPSAEQSRANSAMLTIVNNDAVLLAANTYLHASDFAAFNAAGGGVLIDEAEADFASGPAADVPAASLAKIAIITPGAKKFPEPFAFENFARLLRLRADIDVEISSPVSPDEFEADAHTLAVFTGTGEFTLSDADKNALRKFLDSGGLLLVTPAGGDKQFDRCCRQQLLGELLADSGIVDANISADSPLLKYPLWDIASVGYRRAARRIYGDDNSVHLRLQSIDSRPLIIYSGDDLLVSLAGFSGYDIRGYDRTSAFKLMANILHYATNRELPESSILNNQIQVQWGR